MYSLNQIHNTILNHISDEYQKTEGFATYDLTRGVAYSEYLLWKKAFLIEEKQNVDNLTGAELDTFIVQRAGLLRNEAVKAKGIMRIVSGAGTVKIGSLFESSGGIQYQSTEKKNVSVNDTFKVEAVIAGSVGNVAAGGGNMIPRTIDNIGSAINDEPMSGGYDAETDDAYRERYYEYLQMPPTCGNKYHYIFWAKEVDGVRAAKVIPCWQGKNTVKVIIIGNDYEPAAPSLVKAVQDYIDPDSKGEGLGQAPIGAVTTVVAATKFDITIDVRLKLLSGYELEDVEENLKNDLTAFFKENAFFSEYISYGKVGAAILNTTGVKDYEDLKINGAMANVEIDFEAVALLKAVNIS